MPCRIASVLLAWSCSEAVEISNSRQRVDVDGQPMDLHDGNVAQWEEGGLYYWYGMGYRDCSLKRGLIPPKDCPGIYRSFGGCGFRDDHAVNIYSSPDLVSWSFEGEALPVDSRPYGIYFRPKVIYNNRTGEYVLWVNHLHSAGSPLKAYPDAAYVVATSRSPAGPFEVVTERASLGVSGAGDSALFVDPRDGSAYIAYDAWGNSHKVSVERLTDDYHDSLGLAATSGAVSPASNEAPALFERAGWYYLLFGSTCCFCRSGSNAQVYVARSPLGPYSAAGYDIDGSPGIGPEGGVLPYNSTVGAQENGVFRTALADGETGYIWTGDRWGSAPDGLKSHDFQYWEPLSFDDSTSPPTISPLKNVDSFSLTLADARASFV